VTDTCSVGPDSSLDVAGGCTGDVSAVVDARWGERQWRAAGDLVDDSRGEVHRPSRIADRLLGHQCSRPWVEDQLLVAVRHAETSSAEMVSDCSEQPDPWDQCGRSVERCAQCWPGVGLSKEVADVDEVLPG
jgi:hypothetical protein